jgi:hypothetical protein
VAYTLTGRFSYLLKVLLAYASLAIFVGLVITVSRGAWVACGLSLLVLFSWLVRQVGYRLQALMIGGSLAAIILVFFLQTQFSHHRSEALKLAISTEDVRFLLWQPAAQMWQDHLWWGVGPGHFDHRFPQYRPETFDLQYRPERTHNDYLNTLVDWGLVGVMLVTAAWGLFYGDVFRSWKYVQRSQDGLAAKRSNRTSLVMGGAVGLLAILLHSFVDFNMQVPSNAILAVTLMALVSGHFRFATERYWMTVRGALKILVTFLLAAGLAYLGRQTWHQSVEQYWLRSAAKAKGDPAAQVEALQKAIAADDRDPQAAFELGEAFRLRSFEGREGYRESAQGAMKWFNRSMELNPFDALSRIRYGMCLDWIGQHADAERYFKKALELDPHGYLTLAHVGWHYVQVEDYPTAERWLEMSCRLLPMNNPVGISYLRLVRERMAQKTPPK